MTRPKISLCMIVKNEESCLERCLDSVKTIVDEIVIVDTGSTDRTLQILEERGITAHHYSWNHHFGDARNHALSFATGEYILQLDADEYLDDSTKDALKDPLDCDCYILKIRNDLGSGFNEIHSSIRLFRNSPEIKYVGALHEHIDTETKKCKHGKLSVLIHHDGYQQYVIDKKNKNKRNMQIIKKEAKLNPDAFNLYNLGVQLKIEGEHLAAIDAFKKSFAAGSNYTFTPKLLVYLGQSLMELNRHEESLAVFRDSIALYPTYTDLHYFKGFVYEKIEYFRDAEACYKKCLEIGEVSETYHNSQEGVGSYLAHAQLAELYLKEERREESLNHALEALKGSKNSFPTLKVFLQIFPGGERKQLYGILKQVWNLDSDKDLELLLIALYQIRHPLLLNYVEEYNVSIPYEMQRFLLLMEKQYEEVIKREMENGEAVIGQSQQYGRDMLLLSFVTKDESLYNSASAHINLNHKESKILKKMVQRADVSEKDLSDEFYVYVSGLLEDVLHVQEFDAIDYFGSHVHDPYIRLVLSEKLVQYGFHEVALNVLLESDSPKLNARIFEIAAKALKLNGDNESSYYYYRKCAEIEPSFKIWDKLHDICIERGENMKASMYLDKMLHMKPVSELFNMM